MEKDKFEKFKKILEEYNEINNIELKQFLEIDVIGFTLNEKEFLICIHTQKFDFPIILTTCPKDEPHYLPFNKELGFRKICLFDEFDFIKTVVSDEDKIRVTIEKLIELEKMTRSQKTKEYLKEFPIYWNRVAQKGEGNLELYLNYESDYEWLNKYYYGDEKARTIRYMSDDIYTNDKDKRKNFSNIKALYLKVLNTSDIMPPINGIPWDSTNILNIICNHQISRISEKAYDEICNNSYSKKELILILNLDGFYIACCLKFKNAGTAKLIKKITEQLDEIIPLTIRRCDFNYLSNQIGNDDLLKDKHILLIGVGSLGSYISEELIKSGCKHITIYDDDNYDAENICRHKYPFSDVGDYKTTLSMFYLNKYHPQIKVDGKIKKFSSQESIDEYDLIIVTVGNSDKQIELNEFFSSSFKNKPVIYSWLEGDGKSSHAFCSFNNGTGCYKCLFVDENGNFVKNKLNISKPSELAYRKSYCGGTRVQYGTATLLAATLITLKAVEEALLDGKISFVYNFTNGTITRSSKCNSNGCDVCNDN